MFYHFMFMYTVYNQTDVPELKIVSIIVIADWVSC